jgi:hypothetical protein
MRSVFLIAFLSLAAANSSSAIEAAQTPLAEFYVAPGGKATNDGSKTAPWDWETALAQPKAVKPGSVIWVRGGTYGDGKTTFHSQLVGTSAKPIIVREYPGERATINGWLQIGCCDQDPQPSRGGYVWFWGLEFTNSITDRTGSPQGPPDWGKSAVPNGVDSWAKGTKFINLVIHDTREGIGWWSEAEDGEAYGNLIYFNGFQASDRGHGHGIYVQNHTGRKLIEDNVVFDQFGIGIHGYGSSKGWVRGVTVRGNTVFGNGTISNRGLHDDNLLFGVGTGVDDLDLDSNFTYQTPADDQGHSSIGWQLSPGNKSARVTNNYFIGGDVALMLARWDKLTFTGNTVLSNSKIMLWLDLLAGQTISNYEWNNNHYFGSGKFNYTEKQMPWDTWRDVSHLDVKSKFTPGRPTGEWSFVRPNKYEPGRANITIYNWDLKSTVSVDVSGVLKKGASYVLKDAQDFFGPPVLSGIYKGTPLSIPMTGKAVSKPNGNIPTAPKNTAPEFGVFILLPA